MHSDVLEQPIDDELRELTRGVVDLHVGTDLRQRLAKAKKDAAEKKEEKKDLVIDWDGLQTRKARLTIHRIGYYCSGPYSGYLGMGSSAVKP